MTTAHARTCIRIEPSICFRDRIMACNNFVCLEGFGKFSVCMVRTIYHTNEIHHFAKSNDAIPRHAFANFVWPNDGSRIFKSWHGWHTRRRGNHSFKRRVFGIFQHRLHTLKPKHVGNLMRIPINAHRAVRDNSTGVFANTNHGGFHVNMAVQKTRRDIRTCCIYNCCVLANTMSSVAHIGNATLHNGNIHAVLDLSSTYIDQPRPAP